MKQYYTLVQPFVPVGRLLGEYLNEQGITYTLGADFSKELKRYGYIDPSGISGKLQKTYKVLINEYELSAIKLSVGGVDIIQNCSSLNLKNKVRSCFSWILD